MKAQVNKVTIEVIQQDIWSLPVEAVVYQTDATLSLTPALTAHVGAGIADDLKRIGRCDVGGAVMTNPGKLAVKKLILAVGPRWGEGSERGKLASATWECLRLTEAGGLTSVALPAISTGALGYPLENCATTMLTQMIDFTFENLKHLRRVVLCLDNPVALDIFVSEFDAQLQQLRQNGEGKVRV